MPFDDFVFLDEKGSDDDPPPTDMFYPLRTLLSRNLLDTVKFALALGLGVAALFSFISLLVALRGSPELTQFFTLVVPGFTANAAVAFITGFVWSFLIGFVLGSILALVYNHQVRTAYLDKKSWEQLS